MIIFITGACGFLGLPLVNDLLSSGHTVIGLAQSDAAAATIERAGARVLRGDVTDADILREGARQADGVVHLASNGTFAEHALSQENDTIAIEALVDGTKGTSKPLIVTSGLLGYLETEFDPNVGLPCTYLEVISEKAAEQGVNIGVVRLPQVHNTETQGYLVTYLVDIAREKGESVYVKGSHYWAAVHVNDAVRVFALALELMRSTGSEQGVQRFHAVAEEKIPLKSIAGAIAKSLGVPTREIMPSEANDALGPFGTFVQLDVIGSSKMTRQRLQWEPKGPTLLEDLAAL